MRALSEQAGFFMPIFIRAFNKKRDEQSSQLGAVYQPVEPAREETEMNPCLIRARDGDPEAIRDLVESLRPRITSMASYYARRCGEDPEDLLQEAWIGLLEALPEVNIEIGSPEQYLIQRARWRLLDDIKRSRVRRCVPLEQDVADAVPFSGGLEGLDGAFMSQFMVRLKDGQKQVLNGLMSGMTWREVGSQMGCSSANIAYHVRQIRQRFEDWEAEQPSLSAKRIRPKTRRRPFALVRNDRIKASGSAQARRRRLAEHPN
ncbi:MAG: sigma-70 family RNA polymerase sigma factor [Armatimonadota bacterium]